MTAKSSPGLTTPETSRRRDRFSLTTCNPRKISCTGRESSGYTNCNAELSTLEQTNVWLRISFHFLAEDRILGSLDFNSINNRIGTRRKFRKFGTIWERIIFYSSPGRNLYKKYFRNLRINLQQFRNYLTYSSWRGNNPTNTRLHNNNDVPSKLFRDSN